LEESKTFFFEKNKQKTFATLASVYQEGPKPKLIKVFCFFSSEKKSLFCLLCYWAPPRPSPKRGEGEE
jgi:hypothetical protein